MTADIPTLSWRPRSGGAKAEWIGSAHNVRYYIRREPRRVAPIYSLRRFGRFLSYSSSLSESQADATRDFESLTLSPSSPARRGQPAEERRDRSSNATKDHSNAK